MAERGSRTPADERTASSNVGDIIYDEASEGRKPPNAFKALDVTDALRRELAAKGLKGFKRGGKVKKTGVYKLHAGEKVVTAKKAAQESRDKKLLQKTRYRR